MSRALILVDIQNDFMPTGALPVPEGDQIVPVVNSILPKFELIIATQDFHPADHGSFAANHEGKQPGEFIELDGLTQILWPVHCVQQSEGAELVDALEKTRIARVFPKGTDPMIDSYSGLFDNGHRKSTGLAEHLREQGVEEVFVVGLATDYCVKFTALDAQAQGFKTTLIADACRGVNLSPGDDARAIEAMREAGVRVIQSADLRGGPQAP